MAFGFYYGAFHVESCLALCSRVSSSPFVCDHIAWGIESWFITFHAFICLFCTRLSLSSWSGDWLKLVIVALPGLFIKVLDLKLYCADTLTEIKNLYTNRNRK